MTELFLSRLRLRRDASTAALVPLLFPADGNVRAAAAHHLLWSLFTDGPDRRRDFLWRDDGSRDARRGQFLVLSSRPPIDQHHLFELETKPFAPELRPDMRLRFSLRANAVWSEPIAGARRGKRRDPVAQALAKLPAAERAARRHEVTIEVGTQWLTRQGERAGFRLDGPLAVDGAEWRVVPREKAKPITFGVLDFEGALTVSDPTLFLTKLASGFGAAKAFGCGLMLIRKT